MRNFSFLVILLLLAILSVFSGYLLGTYIFNGFENKEITIENQMPENRPTVILFAGDIMLSRSVAKQMENQGDFRYPFLKIADTVRSADLAFANLEGPISNRGYDQGSIYSFRASLGVVEGLKFAGFDALSLANNHSLDWGNEALIDTVDVLRENGIDPVGAGKNYLEANSAVIKNVNGNNIGFLAYTNLYPKNFEAGENYPGISSFDIESAKNKISQLKESGEVDIIIVSFHWGEEYEPSAGFSQREIAGLLVESGADLVVGHHPHVVQELEGNIAYSLGNFVFDQSFSKETMEGLVLKVVIREKKISEIIPVKIKINNAFQPEEISI